MREISKAKTLFAEKLPFWQGLKEGDRQKILGAAAFRSYEKGAHLHSSAEDCNGLILLNKGILRAYILSEAGKEMTLFRLLEGDICILSASCMMKKINFDLYVETQEESEAYLIPAAIYDELNQSCVEVANFTNQIMFSRLSDVMEVVEQVLFMRFDRRLAIFLLEQANLCGSDILETTHESIARHMGSAREVVSRMLKDFQDEGMVSLSRGKITIKDRKKLLDLA